MSYIAGVEAGILLGKKIGGGNSGTFRGISDDGNSIVISTDEETSYNYTYETFTYTDSISVTKTETDAEGTQTITKNTQNFSKTIITTVYNSSGNKILEAKYDDKANITGYFDSDGKEIIING